MVKHSLKVAIIQLLLLLAPQLQPITRESIYKPFNISLTIQNISSRFFSSYGS